MMYLYDDEELKERKKEQMYGNMYLIEKPVSTKYKDINFEYCDKICQNLIK